MQYIAFKDSTSTTQNFLQQNFRSIIIKIKNTKEKRNKTQKNMSTNLKNSHKNKTITQATITAYVLKIRLIAREKKKS